jgi:hypothetical protein
VSASASIRSMRVAGGRDSMRKTHLREGKEREVFFFLKGEGGGRWSSEREPAREIAIGAARSVRGGYPRRLHGDAATAGGYSEAEGRAASSPCPPPSAARRAESGEGEGGGEGKKQLNVVVERKPRLGWWKVWEEASRRLPAAQRAREREGERNRRESGGLETAGGYEACAAGRGPELGRRLACRRSSAPPPPPSPPPSPGRHLFPRALKQKKLTAAAPARCPPAPPRAPPAAA